MAKRGLKVHAQSALVVLLAQRWLEEQAPAIAEAVSVRTFKDGVLTINCAHSIALHEIAQLRTNLTVYLERECPKGGVKDIRVSRPD